MFQSSSIERLLHFLERSPTAWHATAGMIERFEAAGFEHLEETERWSLRPGGRYYCTRNGSALVAFQLPESEPLSLRIMGAHTDSPMLRIKREGLLKGPDWLRLGVEVYGGALLAPWFDRDLGIAGRVHVRTREGRLAPRLLDIDRAMAVIPSLAIHLDREANQGRAINAQTQMSPVLYQSDSDENVSSLEQLIEQWLREQHAGDDFESVVDFELGFYDVQPPARVGMNGEMLSGARLDNLLSCFCSMEALIDSDHRQGALLIANDHEEIGSGSSSGAQGTFLGDVLGRLAEYEAGSEGRLEECRVRMIQRSRLISCDNAHARHPAWPDKHDAQHAPQLNGGPVIKVNSSQRYATNSATGALFRDICREAGVPVQTFVSRADMPCGSTIGPLTATTTGLPTLDIGLAQWAMHSIRETSGAMDPDYLIRALTAFCNRSYLD
ncbi:M18 family aminopeptidase [Kushneria phosphatilytica]|uniref:M18 family aminopeptidase n=1 Tax=Kushneria phosphatilytica TaxID=657387 RepID=A0A1S1NWF4_9GAMM|nr:M18 family aminopeptidase [Kushneria phosphatilytica]OHV12291.1 M18 family aminopeptidase [Kushneria phosphatilytica]QEL11495.1 M18 family aminopeptidase [Kushneria phosphatilytica]